MNSEDSIKDLLIIKATTTEILFALEALHVKLPKTSWDTMDVTKVAGGIYREYWLRIIEREVLVKDEY